MTNRNISKEKRTPWPKISLLLVLLTIFLGWRWQETVTNMNAAESELNTLRQELELADTIKKGIDGDTVILEQRGIARILGIDTPELRERQEDGTWVEIENPDPRGIISAEWVASLEGRKVRVQYEKQREDRFGRQLVHLYLLPDGPDLANHILRQGWAELMVIPPNTARYRQLKQAYQQGLRAQKNQD